MMTDNAQNQHDTPNELLGSNDTIQEAPQVKTMSERIARRLCAQHLACAKVESPVGEDEVDQQWHNWVEDAQELLSSMPELTDESLADDPWALVGFLKEKLRQAEDNLESLRNTCVRLARGKQAYGTALKDVVNPLGRLQRQAEADGNHLSEVAHSVANDLGFVQSIAREALSAGSMEIDDDAR